MRKFVIIGFIFAFLIPCQLFALPEVKSSFPKTANYFLHWTISDEEAKELAKWDLLVLDMENQVRSKSQIEMIRSLNPDIIILAYITPVELFDNVPTLHDVVVPLRKKLMNNYLRDEWYLTDVSGNRRSFWPGTSILNITDRATQITLSDVQAAAQHSVLVGDTQADAQHLVLRWNEYLPVFVKNEILSSGLWDGVFYDNGWGDPSHHTGVGIDLDRNGIAESPEEVNLAWKQGMKKLFNNTRALLGQDYLVMINGNADDYAPKVDYAPEVNGVMFEYFPRQGWQKTITSYIKSVGQNIAPSTAVINSISQDGRQNDYQNFRFGLSSTLLSDGYYSFDYGIYDHGQLWQYDEYGIFLGEAIGGEKREKSGVWKREFEQGIVFVNPGATERTLMLAAEIEKIRGFQDPITNDGRVTRQLTIGAQDGIIVLRPLEFIFGAVHENGIFARVFDSQGETARAGFFSLDRKEQAGVTIARIDLDGDEKMEKVKMVEKGKMEIVFGDGILRRLDLRISGDPISVAFGDLGGDGVKEIIVAGKGQVRVFRPNGTLVTLPFFPFGVNYKGGVNVAVGDLNNDGFSEIIIGAGAGGGPQVRIFSGEGRLISGGFFAYDPRFRGGVRVAVGDTDGDGSAEIITGPGTGGGPQIRLFNNKGQPLTAGFFAFDRSSRDGVVPIVVDVNKDGKNEILAVQQ